MWEALPKVKWERILHTNKAFDFLLFFSSLVIKDLSSITNYEFCHFFQSSSRLSWYCLNHMRKIYVMGALFLRKYFGPNFSVFYLFETFSISILHNFHLDSSYFFLNYFQKLEKIQERASFHVLLLEAFGNILVKLKMYVGLNPTIPFLDVLDKIKTVKKSYFLLLYFIFILYF